MAVTLITGGNKGLGQETARQLVKAGHTVYAGARDVARGQAAARELGARFVPLGSSLGSEGVVTDPAKIEFGVPALAYGSSKAAVIMLTVQYAKALEKIKVNVVEPGYTATDLNGNRGPMPW